VRSGAVSRALGLLAAAALLAVDVAAQAPILGINKVAAPAEISAGDTATFVIVVFNSGNASATNVTLIDTLPAGLTWSESNIQCAIDAGTRILTCGFGTLVPGGVATVTVTAPTDKGDCGSYPNVAQVAASNHAPVPASATVVVNCPDMTLVKVPDDPRVAPGSRTGFTLVVRNDGAGIARDIVLTDPRAAMPGASSLSPAQPGCDIQVDGQIRFECSFGDLAPGTARAMHIVYTPASTACGTFGGEASLSGPNIPVVIAEAAFRVFPPGDVNGDCVVSVLDVFHLINFLFAGGPAPV
jgi:uncharacterized repeat protein (TIGR01451 family)